MDAFGVQQAVPPTHPIVELALEALAKAGAPEGMLTPVDITGLPALFDAAAEATGNPVIGLDAGANLVIRATNPVIYLMMSAPDC